MADRMLETLTQEQILQLHQDSGFVEINEDYLLLAETKPFKDKCYYVLKTVDNLVPLLQCVSCLNDKVDEILHGHIPNRQHFEVSSSIVVKF